MHYPSSLRTALERSGHFTELIVKHLIVWIVQALVLVSMAGLFPAIMVYDFTDAMIVIVVVAAIGALVMPGLIRYAVRLKPLFFPLISFLLYAWALLLLDQVLPGWKIDNWWVAGLTAAVLTGVASFLGSFLSLSDDAAWQRYALRPMRARYAGSGMTHDKTSGFVFLEIDGLSEPVLRRAIAAGYSPNLARWIESGTHRLTPWECDLSSQTSAMQAGILLGVNDDIPAFRWYDRELGRVVVSNRARDAGFLQRALLAGNGLLVNNGASRGNLFSGDAPDSLFTFATLMYPATRNTSQYFLFYSNLYNLARTMALFVADFFHELFAATWQLVRNERPRVRRFGVYPLVRSATTSILRELSTFTVAGDMFRGVPAVYTTYVAYDEVAHHSGVERGDALRVLRQLDRDIGRLAKIAAEAPRPYHLVVLSDHGQTQGATFRQRYGTSLSGVVERAIHRSTNGLSPEVVHPDQRTDEGWEMVSVLLTDFLKNDRSEHPVFARALGRRMHDGQVAVGPDQHELDTPNGQERGRVVVLASGNLGLVSFTGARQRMTMEAIDAMHAELMPALIAHPGIGFVVVETADRGPLAIGRSGFHALRDDRVHGTSPLEAYSPHVPNLLRRASKFRNAPDILLVSTYWPQTNEVAAFEELVSSHGGIGGDQSTPFVLSPVVLDLGPLPVVGAPAVHQIFKRWLADASHGEVGRER